MKIQLDTEEKTIKLESNVELSKLVETLNRLLPNDEWKEFTLETNTQIIGWSSPVVIHDHYQRPYWQPWYDVMPSYTVRAGSTSGAYEKNGDVDIYQLKSGVYNVQA